MLNNTLASILTLFLSFQVYSQSLNDISFGTDSTFDVVTWNIEWFPKNGTSTIDSVSRIIESLDADLLGLQEIDDTTLCRQMIDNLPGYDLFMDYVWFGGLAYVYKTSSINIQSIYKIYDTAPFWNAFPRSPLVIELTFMGEEFIVINNHFKCCGDGFLDLGNSADEEARRYEASSLLKQYIDANFSSSRVIVIGDLNDMLTDNISDNVYQMFIDDSSNYMFADMAIANGTSAEWSFPGWPSHLDHLLLTNELFTEFSNAGSEIKTIKVDDYLVGGLTDYNLNISDHRPVALKIQVIPTSVFDQAEEADFNASVFPNPISNSQDNFSIDLGENNGSVKITITDVYGRRIRSGSYNKSQLLNLELDGPPGVYLLIVESEEKKAVVRLVKE